MTTRKTIPLTVWIFVSKVMSLLFNMLSRFVIAFLQRSRHLLISWLQSPSAVILESKKLKSDTVSIVSPSICHEAANGRCVIKQAEMVKFELKSAWTLEINTKYTHDHCNWDIYILILKNQ